ncbi:MAG: LysR family transcriptional regulator [Verrucomicrobiota bacterium JB022]|nr:LysR family transcriptional regulator [Verrucomicrobiota bacterium JB022]
MLSRIRAFLTVLEEGSLHRAATRLRISQPALSRQMQALEHELGGPLLERSSTGVLPTKGGQALAEKLRPLLEQVDAALDDVRQTVQGHEEQLRIGYLASAAAEFLEPALIRFRQQHGPMRLKLFDLSPGEQIAGLRAGELDLVLTDDNGKVLADEFYTRKLVMIRAYVALPGCHPLTQQKQVHLAELKHEKFVGTSEDAVPGMNHTITRWCQQYGHFKPRFVSRAVTSDDAFALVVNEEAVAIVPGFMRNRILPSMRILPLADEGAVTELLIAWRRGKTGPALQTLVQAFAAPLPPID